MIFFASEILKNEAWSWLSGYSPNHLPSLNTLVLPRSMALVLTASFLHCVSKWPKPCCQFLFWLPSACLHLACKMRQSKHGSNPSFTCQNFHGCPLTLASPWNCSPSLSLLALSSFPSVPWSISDHGLHFSHTIFCHCSFSSLSSVLQYWVSIRSLGLTLQLKLLPPLTQHHLTKPAHLLPVLFAPIASATDLACHLHSNCSLAEGHMFDDVCP
jgi:hypothetical protein